MSAHVMINTTSLGEVLDPQQSVVLLANHGSSKARAEQFEFRRVMGQTKNDAADDVLYALVAGKGRGEVTEFDVKVVYHVRGRDEELGTLKLERATIHSYREDDAGAVVHQHVVIRAAVSKYTAAGGQAVVELNVLADTARR